MDFTVESEPRPILPDGIYNAAYVKASRGSYYGPKLYIHFRIVDEGPCFGVEIFRAYNLYQKLCRASDLYRDLSMIYGSKVQKNTRLSLKLFRGKVFRIRTRTVTQDRKQTRLPEHERYSVVDQVISMETGGKSL